MASRYSDPDDQFADRVQEIIPPRISSSAFDELAVARKSPAVFDLLSQQVAPSRVFLKFRLHPMYYSSPSKFSSSPNRSSESCVSVNACLSRLSRRTSSSCSPVVCFGESSTGRTPRTANSWECGVSAGRASGACTYCSAPSPRECQAPARALFQHLHKHVTGFLPGRNLAKGVDANTLHSLRSLQSQEKPQPIHRIVVALDASSFAWTRASKIIAST